VNIWRRYELEYGVSLFLTHSVYAYAKHRTHGDGQHQSIHLKYQQ